MEIACTHCQAKFKVPDEKLPQGQVLSIGCPKCKSKISIDTRSKTSQAPPKPSAEKTLIDEVSSGTYDASEKPFDFVEEGTKTALVCEPDAAIRNKIETILKQNEFHTTEPTAAMEALKQMRFHVFDVIVINELFDTQEPQDNHVLHYLDNLTMGVRRNIFVILLTQTHRTNDNMVAFHKSVNLVVNLKNLDQFEKIFTRGLADYGAFYRVFKESLVKAGLT